MLRIIQNSNVAGAKSYYTHGDYYSQEQESVGQWGGKAAERLGLKGEVTKEAFEALCENKHPATGKQLTGRNRETRTVGWDFNFHCPKSVSLVHAFTGDQRILDAFQAAVRETLGDIEADARTRVRKHGQDSERVSGNLVWAEFIHETARPVGGVPDPHLHLHAFCLNATFDEEEQAWKAVTMRETKRDGAYYEALFHNRFAGKLAAQGWAIERTAKGWELAGVPADVIERFSRRTAQIEEAAETLGVKSAAEKDKLGAKTRAAKEIALTKPELQQMWESWLKPGEREAIASVAAHKVKPRPLERSVEAVWRYAKSHAYERASVVRERQLEALALKNAVGSLSVDEVRKGWNDRELIRHELEGQRVVTTREVLRDEEKMLAFARNGRGACRPLGGQKRFESSYLNDQQTNAVRHLLESTDRVMAVRGAAGVGKTTLLKEAVAAIEKNGRKVFAFAPSAEASRGVLRAEGFSSAETVAHLLQNSDLQKQLHGQVILVDEASLLSTRQLKEVFEIAEREKARCILVGDVHQHHGVERGDAMRILETMAGVEPVSVTAIQRQSGEYRQAVADLGAGKTAEGFAKLDALGWVQEIGGEDRHRRLATDYLAAVERGESALVVCPTHYEKDQCTGIIRDGLRERGRLGRDEFAVRQLDNLSLTRAMLTDAVNYQPGAGDVVVFHQNVKGFKRGEKVEVAGRDERGNVLVQNTQGERRELPLAAAEKFNLYTSGTINLAAGDLIRITQNGYTRDKKHRLNNGAVYELAGLAGDGHLLLKNGWTIDRNYGHLDYGYVCTSHASQGRTVDHVLIGQGTESLPATSRESFYVSVSRARHSAKVYTDDKAALKESIAESSMRLSAVELASKASAGAVPHLELVVRQSRKEMVHARQREIAMLDKAMEREQEKHRQRG